jgi:hypothetical protein
MIKLLLLALLNLSNSTPFPYHSFSRAQNKYVMGSPYMESVYNKEFQHTHPDAADPQPDQPYVGHFSRDLITAYNMWGIDSDALQTCFLRLFQEEINSIPFKSTTEFRDRIRGKLLDFIPGRTEARIGDRVFDSARTRDNPWVDPELNDEARLIKARWNYLKPRQKYSSINPQRSGGKGHYKNHWAVELASESVTQFPYVDKWNMIFLPDELLREYLFEYQYELNWYFPDKRGHILIPDNDPARLAFFRQKKGIFEYLCGVHSDDRDMYWNWMEVMNKRGFNHWDCMPLGRELKGIQLSITWLEDHVQKVRECSMTSGGELHDTCLPGSTAGDMIVPEATQPSSSSAPTSTVTIRWDPWRLLRIPPVPTRNE